MRAKRANPDTHPELHRKLAWYHFCKWLQPDKAIPIPNNMGRRITNHYAPTHKAKHRFLDPLHLIAHDAPIGDRPWELLADMRYGSATLGQVVTVPKGYRTDFASVPRFFWRIIPPYGRYARAAVVHDYLCDLRGSTGIDSATTHEVFREAMKVLRVSGWKRATMYRAVKWFGPRFKAVPVRSPDL